MNEVNDLQKDALEVLKATSRTFFIPIKILAPNLKETVASAYLCMRAIDEIEDHPTLQSSTKSELLYSVSKILQKPLNPKELEDLFQPYNDLLPTVTLRLADWIKICPPTIVDNILSATSTMAEGMAEWVIKDWIIKDEKDLDEYTYYVAGLVGVMLTDIWKWYDNTEADKELAVAFGRGLQSVNILRNHAEDRERGVSFFPEGWKVEDMFQYSRRNLALANEYLKDIKTETILNFCKIPLALAHGTLDALENGKEKMSRAAVMKVVAGVVGRQLF